jgi:thiol-disulfide isomerase/thioredoxin
MTLMTRRVAVAGGMAAATVALTMIARKSTETASPPVGGLVLRPVDAGTPPLRPLADAVQTFPEPRPMPAIRFTAADGSGRTPADFASKGVLLNFWATWCGPCEAELPSLDRLAGELAADNILVLPLASDHGGAAVVEKYYRAHRIAHLGVWLDPDATALHAIAARGIPTTLILDRQGRERAMVEGGANWQSADAAAAIRKLTG